jgi:hypothetical protein
MILMNRRRAIIQVLACYLVLGASQGLADGATNNGPVIRAMHDVIASNDELSDARKQILYETVETIVSKAEDLPSDKRHLAADHLRVYLSEHLAGGKEIGDEHFALVNKTFAWALQNYVAASPLTEAERFRLMALPKTLEGAFRQEISKMYPGVPDDVTSRLAERVSGVLAEQARRWGNYFYPNTLYPPTEEHAGPHEIAKALLNAVGNRSDRYAPVEAIANNTDSTDAEREMHLEFFFEREAQLLAIESSRMLSQVGNKRLQGLSQPPLDLQQAWGNLTMKLDAEGKQRSQELVAREHRSALVREVLAGTGVEVRSGVVQGMENVFDETLEQIESASRPEKGEEPRLASASGAANNPGSGEGSEQQGPVCPVVDLASDNGHHGLLVWGCLGGALVLAALCYIVYHRKKATLGDRVTDK